MATRKIIRIDEDKCNGCGNCITGCAEGALQLVNGKAKLVKEQYCDGFGDCIGHCPTGALTIVEADAEAYDSVATREHVAATRGADGLAQFDAANVEHEAKHGPAQAAPAASPRTPPAGGCPGTRMRMAAAAREVKPAAPAGAGGPAQMIRSDLQQWPVQLHLVQPGAPFFKNRELAILSTCSPIASADAHWRFIRGRGVVVACPKLDNTEPYIEKLAAILGDPSIPKAIVVRMEVPCCGGLSMIARQAAKLSGRTDLKLEEVTVTLDGDVQDAVEMAY